VPIAPVNTSKTIADDPQFRERFPWIPTSRLGAEEMPFPVRVLDGELPVPHKAPDVGEHTDEVLSRVLGYDEERLAVLRKAGVFG
jgi:crotonobetainyl-CoA:carnitine CoA-transferase CaiB-like acyl-CoA transferase